MLYRFITKLKAQWVTFAYPYTIKRYMCTIRTTVLLMIIYENVCLLTNCLQGQYCILSRKIRIAPIRDQPSTPTDQTVCANSESDFCQAHEHDRQALNKMHFQTPLYNSFNIIILYPFEQSMCLHVSSNIMNVEYIYAQWKADTGLAAIQVEAHKSPKDNIKS